MDETMTEEEFYEWLQNAAQAGMFDSAAESPTSAAASNTSGSSSKKKKKGKKLSEESWFDRFNLSVQFNTQTCSKQNKNSLNHQGNDNEFQEEDFICLSW